jgi:Tetraspanin family
LIAYLIIYSGQIAADYYKVPQVEESEPEYLPQVLIGTGIAMILVAFLGYFASRAESNTGLVTYSILCGILMANFMIFTLLLNFGSNVLQQNFEEKCMEIMPYFHRNFYESFGCMNKYT